jgi:hypothetical protein
LTGSGSGSSLPSVSRATTTENWTSSGLLPVSLSAPFSLSLSASPSLTISPSLFSLYSDEGRKERGPKEEKKEKDWVSSLSGSPLCLPHFLAVPSPQDHLLQRKSKRKKREKRRKKERNKEERTNRKGERNSVTTTEWCENLEELEV